MIDADAYADRNDALWPAHPVKMVRSHTNRPVPTLFGFCRNDGWLNWGPTRMWEGMITKANLAVKDPAGSESVMDAPSGIN